MHQININTSQVIPDYPTVYKWALSLLSFLYVFVSFGLSGISSVSRIGLYSAVVMVFLLSPIFMKLKIPAWVSLVLFFYSYLTIPAFVREMTNFNQLGTMITVLLGTISIGLALHNKIITHKVIVYGALIAAGINIVAVYMGIDVASIIGTGRSSGLIGNPNELAINMCLAAFMVWLIPSLFRWPIKSFAIYIAFYGMYVSGSRKGLILAVLLLFLISMDYMIKLSLAKLIPFIIFAVTILIISSTFIVQMANYYSIDIVAVERTLKDVRGEGESISDRKFLINKGYELWKDSLLFGYGFSQFANLSGVGVYAHNNYIELAVTGGGIGLMLFYSLHLIIFQNAFKKTIAFRIRLIIIIFAILLIDAAYVSFYSKTNLCMLVFLLTVSSDSGKYINNNKKVLNNELF